MTGRRGRRGKQLPNAVEKRRGFSKLKEGAVDRNVCGEFAFGRSFGLVVRRNAGRM